MRSHPDSFIRVLRSQWHWAAVGGVAVGSTALLLLPGVAQIPAIVPDAGMTTAPAGIAALPPSADMAALAGLADKTNLNVPPTTQTPQSKINLEFRDVAVTDLIAMIAGQGEVGITIGADVDTSLKLPYIKLPDVTPEEAIRRVAAAANLQFKKLDATTYFVGKNLPSADPTPSRMPAIESRLSGTSGSDVLTPYLNRQDQFFDPTTGQEYTATGALPSIGGMRSANPFNLTAMTNRPQVQVEQTIRPIQIRNVPSRVIAWWVDPKHQPEPFEYQHARETMRDNLSPYHMKSAIDPAVLQAIRGQGGPFVSPYSPGAYTNPYSNPYTNATNPYSPWTQAQYRTNYQFGNFGGNNNNNNNRFGGNNGGGGGFGGNGVLELPDGIDQLVSIDAQNVLLVYGTADGIAKLQTIINYLDKPIRQVEIEAQFIDVSVNESRGFGIQFGNGHRQNTDNNNDNNNNNNNNDNDNDNNNNNSNSNGIGAGVPGANQIVLSFKQAQARINFLTSNGRARIINSPRVTTMNNLSASLQSTQITPIVLTSSTEGIGGQVGNQQNAFFLTTSVGLQVTPTINNDDTVTVFMTPFVQTQVPTPGLTIGSSSGDDDDDDDDNNNNNNNNGGGSSSIPTVLAQSLTTVANVKDNDVIVLGGLRTRTENIVRSRIPILSKLPLIGKLFRSSNKTDIDRELVIFLTARILRRTEDVTPIQGP
jgi:hypothetical protein